MSKKIPNQINTLLVGGGGREHAIARLIKKSKLIGKFWCTHATNPGISQYAIQTPVSWDQKKPDIFVRWCQKENINLVIVGPEAPLAEGIADHLRKKNIEVFGPGKDGAMLESDKSFAKKIMHQVAVPTAEARTFEDGIEAQRYILRRIDKELERDNKKSLAEEVSNFQIPHNDRDHESYFKPSQDLEMWLANYAYSCVIKCAGLAAGKGVIICHNLSDALNTISLVMDTKKFGDAGKKILIEEFLIGQEVSVLALTDGQTLWILDPCQDHKAVGEGDLGPNTGGMGAYCPTPLINKSTLEEIESEILVPTLDGLRREGIDFRGVLFAGIMLTESGPRVLEFNVRFGDPECQVLLSRFQGDFLLTCWLVATQQLEKASFELDEKTACCVVMCSKGYPESFEKGFEINGDCFIDTDNTKIYHSGTIKKENKILTSGGRVLSVTSLASTLKEAQNNANSICKKISFEGSFYRKDIGSRVLDKN